MSTAEITEPESQTNNLHYSDWPWLTVTAGLLVIALLGFYWHTLYSMIEIWWRSETFAHGFLIFPICIWLLWQNHHIIKTAIPKPDWRGLVPLIFMGFFWFVANAADINVFQQMAMIGLIPLAIFTVMGWEVTWKMAFPLFFLVFAIPMGEELVPPLMDFTADFTVYMVQLTGIPVYREGTFFELPSGNWSVVEGCSGVRYLIASITLGVLYAYLTYSSLKKRLLFIAFAIVTPVIANGFRAFLIVMIAHFSDMKLATGVDHLVYGWVWFGIVIGIMFYIGSFWRDDFNEEEKLDEKNDTPEVQAVHVDRKNIVKMLVAVVFVSAIWPVAATIREANNADAVAVDLQLPESDVWAKSETSLSDWQPRYIGADAEVQQTYKNENKKVDLYMAFYAKQRQDAELINTQNVLIEQKHPVWSLKGSGEMGLQTGKGEIATKFGLLRSSQQSLFTQYWYWLDGEVTINRLEAKMIEAKSRLTGGSTPAAVIAITVPYDENRKAARAEIEKFVKDMLPSIEQSLEKAILK